MSTETSILPVKPGSLKPADKKALREAGVVVVEHEDPSSLRLIRPTHEIAYGDMLSCALAALMSSDGSTGISMQAQFTRLIHATMKASRK